MVSINRRRIRHARGGWLLAGIMLIAGCGGQEEGAAPSAPAASTDKTLTIGLGQYPSTWHPNIQNLVAKSYVLAMVTRPMTHFNHQWQNACMLCEKLPTLENGLATLEQTPDGKPGIAVTLSIPNGVTWGDGTPVTTKDVKFTWEVGRHPMSGTNAREFYRTAYTLDVIDDHTFTIHQDRRTFQYNLMPLFILLPEHIERPIFEAAPEAYKNRNTYDSDPTNPGLYYGPYLVDQVERGSRVELRRNPYWYGETPYFDRIVIRILEKTTTLEANLLSGTIDMISGELGMQVDQALAFEKRHGADYNIVYKSGSLFEHVDLKLDNPILSDKRVRKALMYALDRQALVDQLFGGKQVVANTAIPIEDTPYFPDLPAYEHDLDRAIGLLEEAGWKASEGSDIRTNAAGEPLRIELNTTAGDKTRELTAQVLQAQWRQAGFDIRIRNETPRVLFAQSLTERKFTGMAMYAWSQAPEPVPRAILHSSRIPTRENNFAGQNYTGFSDPRVDELIERIENTLTLEERLPLWRQLQEIYIEELPSLPLMFRSNAYILPKWLRGVRPTGHYMQSTLWIEEWHREE